jgi:hypothetical protein
MENLELIELSCIHDVNSVIMFILTVFLLLPRQSSLVIYLQDFSCENVRDGFDLSFHVSCLVFFSIFVSLLDWKSLTFLLQLTETVAWPASL